MYPHYYKKPKPETIKKWIGINKDKFSVESKSLGISRNYDINFENP